MREKNFRPTERGQSIIELAVAMPIFATALIYMLQLFIKLILTVAVNDTLESFLLCRTNPEVTQSHCRQRMTDKIDSMSLAIDSIQERMIWGIDAKELLQVQIHLSHSVLDPIVLTRESRKNLDD